LGVSASIAKITSDYIRSKFIYTGGGGLAQ
jgi:hypothetical protein